MNIIPSIFRIDFNNQSIAFDTDNLVFLHLKKDDMHWVLTITINEGEIIDFDLVSSHTKDSRNELESIYLNLYTTWRNANKTFKEKEDNLLSLM